MYTDWPELEYEKLTKNRKVREPVEKQKIALKNSMNKGV